MKYNIVALFDEDFNKTIDSNYRLGSKQNKLFHTLPLHLVLDTIDDADVNKLNDLLIKILKPYKKFKVHFNNVTTPVSNKSVNLTVDSKGYIVGLIRILNDNLKLSGFKVKPIDNFDNFQVSIALPQSKFHQKDKTVLKDLNNTNIDYFGKVQKIEVWKIINNKKYSIVNSYDLREF